MNEDFLLQYLLQQGAMEPERAQLERRQAYVDALRKRGAEGPQGQMVGRTYVRPSLTQYAAQLGDALTARNAQSALDSRYNAMSEMSRKMIEDEKNRRRGLSAQQTTMGMSGKAPRPEDDLFSYTY